MSEQTLRSRVTPSKTRILTAVLTALLVLQLYVGPTVAKANGTYGP